MNNVINKFVVTVVGLICIVIILLYFYSRFHGSQYIIPSGCDIFGYLSKAEAISRGKPLDVISQRPFDPELIQYLSSKYPFSVYEKAITPHAHHINPHIGKPINQYPIGVGLLLSIFPIHERTFVYPVVCAFLLVFFILLGFRIVSRNISLIDICLMIVVVGFLLNSPFKMFFNIIYSTPASYGMLIAAGYLFRQRPGISLVLVGLASTIRISNLTFFLPCLLIFLFDQRSSLDRTSRSWGFLCSLIRRIVTAGGLFLLGYSANLIYVWCLLGNPFYSTYSSVDTRFIDVQRLGHHLNFYLTGPIFYVHVWLLAFIALLGYRKNLKWVLVALLITIYNYVLVITHYEFQHYYVYASGMMLIGLLLSFVREILHSFEVKVLFRRSMEILVKLISRDFSDYKADLRNLFIAILYSGVLIYACVIIVNLGSRIRFPKADHEKWFVSRIKAYNECFSEYDVVWAGFYTGSVEYTTAKAGFRFDRGKMDIKRDIMRWLYQHGYKQAFLLEDALMKNKGSIDRELKASGIPYKVKTCEGIVKNKAKVIVYDLGM